MMPFVRVEETTENFREEMNSLLADTDPEERAQLEEKAGRSVALAHSLNISPDEAWDIYTEEEIKKQIKAMPIDPDAQRVASKPDNRERSFKFGYMDTLYNMSDRVIPTLGKTFFGLVRIIGDDMKADATWGVEGELKEEAKKGISYRLGDALSQWGGEHADQMRDDLRRLTSNLPEELKGRLWDRPELMLNPKWAMLNIGDATISFVPVMVSYLMAGPAGAGMTGGTMEGEDLYSDLIEEGVKHETALQAATAFGIVTGVLNSLGAKMVFGNKFSQGLAGTAKRFVTGGISEATTEWAEEPFQAAFAGIAKEKSMPEIIEDVGKALTNVDVAFGAGVTGGLISSIASESASLEEPEPQGVTIETTDIPLAIYETNRRGKGPSAIKAEVEGLGKDVGSLVDEFLGAISTRVGAINPQLKGGLREFEFNIRQRTREDYAGIEPFLEGIQTMSKEDAADFDLARKNADKPMINALVEKYGLQGAYESNRAILDAIYARAQEVGIDVFYREEFHPRVIKDSKGLLSFLQKDEHWTFIDRAIRAKEQEQERYLTVEEKAQVANMLLRGYPQGDIKLSKPGALKQRMIPVLTPEMNQFYASADSSLVSYINTVNEAIEARRFFGLATGPRDLTNIDNSIGAFVINQIAQKNIKPEQEQELTQILKARFNQRRPGRVIALYRDFSYLDTMGSFTSGLTQIGDFAWSLYEAGLKGTLKGAWSAVRGKPKISKQELGTERVGAEFSDAGALSSAVQFIFKWTGLSKIDQLAEETLAQSTIEKYQKRVQKTPQREKLRKELAKTWGAERADSMISDLLSGEITEDVKLLAFCRILDFQPKAASEMPEKYLSGGNGRIFYMLKTFTLKQFDIARRECFQKMKEGKVAEGTYNLIRLAAMFMLCNAGADYLKDFLLGRKTTFEDRIVDNLLRLFGVSKFVIWTARYEGIGKSIAKQMLPPFKFIDAFFKDAVSLGKNGFETMQSIPLVGKLYYWWFGKGAEKTEKYKEKAERKKVRKF